MVNKSKGNLSKRSFNNRDNNECKVIGFSDVWWGKRKFPVDMAGFAVNVDFLASRPSHEMPYRVSQEEDGFLRSLNVQLSDFEPLADCATKVYVWHTRTKKLMDDDRIPLSYRWSKQPFVKYSESILRYKEVSKSNIRPLIDRLQFQGALKIMPWNGQKGIPISTCTNPNGC